MIIRHTNNKSKDELFNVLAQQLDIATNVHYPGFIKKIRNATIRTMMAKKQIGWIYGELSPKIAIWKILRGFRKDSIETRDGNICHDVVTAVIEAAAAVTYPAPKGVDNIFEVEIDGESVIIILENKYQSNWNNGTSIEATRKKLIDVAKEYSSRYNKRAIPVIGVCAAPNPGKKDSEFICPKHEDYQNNPVWHLYGYALWELISGYKELYDLFFPILGLCKHDWNPLQEQVLELKFQELIETVGDITTHQLVERYKSTEMSQPLEEMAAEALEFCAIAP